MSVKLASHIAWLKEECGKAVSIIELLRGVAQALATHLSPTLVALCAEGQSYVVGRDGSQIATLEFPFSLTIPFHGAPLYASHADRDIKNEAVKERLKRQGVLSCAVLEIGQGVGAIEVYYLSTPHLFSVNEKILLEESASILSAELTRRKANFIVPSGNHEEGTSAFDNPIAVEPNAFPVPQYNETVLNAPPPHTLFLEVDSRHILSHINGDTEYFFGQSCEELLKFPHLVRTVVVPKDRKKLREELRDQPQSFTCEIRVINRKTRAIKWLLLNMERSGDSWIGIGTEISELKGKIRFLEGRRNRLRALLDIASSPERIEHEDAIVSQTCVELLRLLPIRGAIVCERSLQHDQLKTLKSVGLGDLRLDALTQELGLIVEEIDIRNLATAEVATVQGPTSNISYEVAKISGVIGEGTRYLIVEPRSSYARGEDGEFLKILVRYFDNALTRFKDLHDQSKSEESLSFLYKLSHELSKLPDVSTVAQRAVSLIQERVHTKRLWMGFLNEQASHVVGYAGSGPGIKSRLISVQIELRLRHDFFDEAIRTKRPVVVPAGSPMECSGLTRLIARLNLGFFVVVPLVAYGKVVGICSLEPMSEHDFKTQSALELLTRIGEEVATVVYSRQHEQKLAIANKMKMASLLSSGIAHNFNNLLQAIIGQAGLIEVQQPKDAPISRSARLIMDAATRGAFLIKQLATLSTDKVTSREEISIGEFLEESRDVYRSVLGPAISLEWSIEEDLPNLSLDLALFQQVLTNLLVNAREALMSTTSPAVKVVARRVRIGTGEIDPELSAGDYVRIDVDDNGAGMESDVAARCFEPFFTTKNSDTATGLGLESFGLGLSSAYAVVKNHGGIITLSTSPGAGAEFSIFLPVPAKLHRSVQVRSKRKVIFWGVSEEDRAHISAAHPGHEEVEARTEAEVSQRLTEDKDAYLVVDADAVRVEDALKNLRKTIGSFQTLVISDDPTPYVRGLTQTAVVARPLGPWNLSEIDLQGEKVISQRMKKAQKNSEEKKNF